MRKSPPDTQASVDVWQAMLTTFFRLRQCIRPTFNAYDLTGPQWRVFRTLGERAGKGLTPGQISEELRVTPGNTTGILDKLEQAGLTCRVPHPTDRRALLVELTEQGTELYSRVRPAFDQRVAELFECLTLAEKQELVASLRKIVEHAETVHPQASAPSDRP